MKCSRCEYHYHGSTDRRTKIRYYLDGGYHMGGRDVCDMTLVAAEPFERILLNRIKEKLFNGDGHLWMKREDLVAAIEKGLAEQGAPEERPDPEREALLGRLLQIQKQREEVERLHKAYPGQTGDLLQAVRTQEEEVEKELGASKAPASTSLSLRERRRVAQKIASYRIDFESAFKHGTPEERKRFIRDFVASIEVDGRERKIRVGFYASSGNVALRVVPPTGFEPVLRA